MSNLRPFNEIKLQWLALLSQDKDLSSTAIQIALYIITVHYNQDRGKAWPSFKTIAKGTGKKCTKTIQRAINELEENWLHVNRGVRIGKSSEYAPRYKSIRAATEHRKEQDKIITFSGERGGQKCPKSGTKMSSRGGQKCHPNTATESSYESNTLGSTAGVMTFVRLFVEQGSIQATEWEHWLESMGLHRLEVLLPIETQSSKLGFFLPSRFPPTASSKCKEIRSYLLQCNKATFSNIPKQSINS